jgi:hypothetical protein
MQELTADLGTVVVNDSNINDVYIVDYYDDGNFRTVLQRTGQDGWLTTRSINGAQGKYESNTTVKNWINKVVGRNKAKVYKV